MIKFQYQEHGVNKLKIYIDAPAFQEEWAHVHMFVRQTDVYALQEQQHLQDVEKTHGGITMNDIRVGAGVT